MATAMGSIMKNRINYFFTIFLTLNFIASILLAGWYIYQKYTIVPYYQKHLLAIARQRVNDINTYLSKKEKQLQVIAHEPKVIEFLKNQQNKQVISSFIQSFQTNTGFTNTILIKPDGHVIFASKNPQKFVINVTDHKYRNMSLSQSFDRSIKTMTPNFASFSFDMLLKIPTLYATMPIFHDAIFIGVVAVQINMDDIYAITNNYFDLGKTGDVILAKAIKNGAQIIAPTRNYPQSAFDIIEFTDKNSVTPAEYAVKGKEGSAVTFDFKDHKVIGAWSYIPSLAWGIAITIRYAEASKPITDAYNWWYISIVTFLVILVLWVIWEQKKITIFIKQHIATDPFNIFLCVIIIGTAVIATYLGYRYYNLYNTAINQAHQQAEQKITNTIQLLQKELENVKQRALAIADDLSKQRLLKQDIKIRIERDLKENPHLYGITIAFGPYQFDKQNRLYAPHYVRVDTTYKHEQLEKISDYTKTVTGQSDTSWYQAALKRSTWLKPTKDQLTGKLVARYVTPFYKPGTQEVIGVVVAEFNLDSFEPFMQKNTVGQTGYSFIIDGGGTFIYHPTQSLVTQQKTIFDQAQQQINKQLYDTGTSIIKSSSRGKSSYVDPRTSTTIWVHYAAIPETPWSIALVFIQEEITIPSVTIRHAFMGILTAIVLAILLLTLLLCRILIRREKLLQTTALLSGIILLFGLIALWYIISQTVSKTSQINDEAIINNQTMLTAYLKDRQLKASSQYQKIDTIPTGILINSLTFDNIRTITFSGYIWQKYDNKLNIQPEITIPGATKITLEKIHEDSTGTITTIGWKIMATLPEKLDYTQYPFDRQHCIIPFAYPDQQKLILLIPDFDSYGLLSQEKFIGITREFSLSEFTIETTYFSYKSIEQPQLMSAQVTGENLNLHYTLVLARNTLHAFIIYFIPLFVILFSLFATVNFTNVTDTITSAAIIPYTAPLFALIILHANLRNLYIFGNILYIEYLFFLTYLVILLAISFNILIGWKGKTAKKLFFFSIVIKLFFWPAQFMLWYAATIIAFY
jgi:C4-dicarboxylate-specific signal transduction histidine kinase